MLKKKFYYTTFVCVTKIITGINIESQVHVYACEVRLTIAAIINYSMHTEVAGVGREYRAKPF